MIEARQAEPALKPPTTLKRAERREDAAKKENGMHGLLAQTNGTVVVVDDDGQVRRVVTLLLESLGYHVTPVASGAALLALLQSDATPVRAILLDMTMPGVTGATLVRLLQSGWPATPLLLMTGYRREDLLAQFEELRGLPFLQKPFSRATLQHACVAVC